MAFANTALQDNPDLPAGEVIAASPNNVSAFEIFENGLIEGRFCKYDSGSIDNLDASATPVLAGIVRRKLTGEIGTGIYSTTGATIDQVAEVINFGFATVTVTAAATPVKFDQVYTVNAATADAGKATDDSGQLIVPGAIFWEQKASNVWLVRIMMGVETSTSYVGTPSTMEVSAVDNEDATATVTVQAKSADGTDYADNVLFRFWVGGADDFLIDAITDILVPTGTLFREETANAAELVITDATGLAEITLSVAGGGTTYAWAEIGGNIFPLGAIVVTA
jgi:hypothetical protein